MGKRAVSPGICWRGLLPVHPDPGMRWWWWENWGDVGQRIQVFYWRSNAQHSVYSQWYCNMSVKIAKRLDLKFSPQKEMVNLYSGHLIWKVDSLEKILMLGIIEGRRRRGDRGWGDWMTSWLNGHEFEWTPGDSEGQGSLVRCSPWGCKVLDMI